MVKSRGVLWASCAVIALIGAGGSWGLADDFVVDAPSNQTNDGNILNNGDSITITESGSISPPAGDEGVQATGTEAVTAINLGTITTSGNDARGIELFNNSTATNAGTITTVGTISHGIIVNNSSSVENSGMVTTSGSNADGIFLGSDSIVTNSGTIATSGDRADGIALEGTGNTAINTGTITTSGDLASSDPAAGIDASSGNTIINSGTIRILGYRSSGIFGQDGNVVTNLGAIAIDGNLGEGINLDDNNLVRNSGTITTIQNSSQGISLEDNNTVTNSGAITTSGISAAGIEFFNDNEVVNSGTIATTGERALGIVGEDSNIITNTGRITTDGYRAFGVWFDQDNMMTNFGTISTGGEDADGIWGDFRNTVVNSGTISTSGIGAEGISLSDTNTLTNTGTVATSGVGAAAILGGRSATINNFGHLVSVQSDAIRFTSPTDPSTLNLHAPSFLGGQIDLGTNTTVNIFSGPSHSILWDLSTGTMEFGAPNLSGPVPIFYNSATSQVATFDPTALSGSANALGDMSGNLSALMGQRLSLSRASGGAEGEADASFLSAYSGNEETTDNTAIDRIATAFRDTSDADTGWWVSGFGSYADHDGTAATLDHTYDHFGVATGYDWQPSSALTLGAMVGYGTGSFDTDSRFAGSFDNSADGAFAGFYGRADLANSMFVDFALSGGLLSHSDSRFVNDNLAPLGVSSASADYDSWWLSPELTLGMEISDVMGSQWSYIPSASVRYALQSVDGYTETGPSAANATVNAHDVAMLETRLELAGMRDFELATLRGHFGGRFGWQHRSAMGDDAVAITMIGQNNSVSTFSQDGSTAYVGVDAAMDVGNSASLALGGEYSFSGTVQALRGTATLTIMF